MQKNMKVKKTFRFILPMLAAGAIMAASVNTSVKADDPVKGSLPVYNIDLGDSNIASTLKSDVITDRCKIDDNLNVDDINIDLSSIDITGLDYTKAGIQTVTLKVNLVYNNNTTDSVGYSFTQDAAVNMKVVSAPQLKLKANEVTVNNGDTFIPESFISYVKNGTGDLPALSIDTQSLDMNVDGTYPVTYKAVDLQGNTTSATLLVNVRTPQEVLDAQAQANAEAEAEAQAQAEADAQAQAEEEARKAAEEAAALNAASGDTANLGYSNDGTNPYGGGWSNCTYGAWQALYNARGIALPNLGNASSWYSNAAALGYSVSSTPTAGGIAVYNGHVAYVDAVDGNLVHIVEGGFNGHYNERWVSSSGTGTKSTIGYINV